MSIKLQTIFVVHFKKFFAVFKTIHLFHPKGKKIKFKYNIIYFNGYEVVYTLLMN